MQRLECPYCKSSQKTQVKSGHNRSGTQRYKCQRCQRIYTPQPKVYNEQFRLRTVWYYRTWTDSSEPQYKPSVRKVAGSLGINHQTLTNWIDIYNEVEIEETYEFIGYSPTEKRNKFVKVYRIKE